ncbi:hypothetical protein EDB86DRAFT_2830303 [Lactarius hatsudake]|nr:hypothetical protein EDB86DRAFT_2830303 [Lactarius hatsudake]
MLNLSAKAPLPHYASSVLPMPAHARARPANSRSLRFPPGFPSTNAFSVIWDDARTCATAFCPSVTPRSTYTAPPSNSLSRVRGYRKKAASNTSDATPDVEARPVHTPSNAGHTDIFSPDVLAVSQQSTISIAPPPRAVFRKGDLSGPLAYNTRGTTPTSASSTAASIPDTPGVVSALPHPLTATPSYSGSVTSRADLRIAPPHAVHGTLSPSLPTSGNTYSQSSPISSRSRSDYIPSGAISPAANDSSVHPQQQQSAPLVPATTPDFPQPFRDPRPSPGDADGPGPPAHLRTHFPTVAP